MVSKYGTFISEIMVGVSKNKGSYCIELCDRTWNAYLITLIIIYSAIKSYIRIVSLNG